MRKMITMPEMFCLICSVQLDASSCVNIFCTSLPHDGELLASFVLRVLRPVVSDLHSSYVCLQCYNLFQMLEQAQWNVTSIRCEILKVYCNGEKGKTVKHVSEDETDSLCKKVQEEMFAQQNKLNIDNTLKLSKNMEIPNLCSNKTSDEVDNALCKNDCLNEDLNVSYNSQNVEDEIMNIMQTTDSGNVENTVYEEEVSLNAINKINGTTNSNNSSTNHISSGKSKNMKNKESFKSSNIGNTLCTSIASQHNNSNVHDNISIYANNALSCANKLHTNCSDKTLALGNKDEYNIKLKEDHKTVTAPNESSESVTGNTSYDHNSFDTVHKEGNSTLSEAPWKSAKTSKCSSKPFNHTCSTCGKRWRTSTELKTHVKSHSTLRPYMCEKCGQAYKHKHALEIHVGMHNGINPFQCSFCKKCFTQKGALMRHLPMHTGETPYQCELCGKRFVHHTSYNMHALSHTGKKSYQCHVCDLSLLSTSHLKRHMRVHTGEKPYSCTLCGKRFAERYNLFAHQKIHDPGQITSRENKKAQYICDQCNLPFNKKQKLDDHLKCHHNSNNKQVSKKVTDQVFDVPPETIELTKLYTVHAGSENDLKGEESDDRVVNQTWSQISHTRLHNADNQTKVILFQNSLSQGDASSLAITFNEHKVSLEDSSYNTNLQVIIEPPTLSHLTGNLTIDKAHI